ncbi:hypothetical protein ABT023_27915 [Micromonospora sp. NPDC002296]|uniref:hypothetical protein n=1 Tax=Micromonospora sp. NPDC002296 TaxID=3154271 RepID=UPI00332A3D08
MIRALPAPVVLVALAAALAGCSSDSEPAAAPPFASAPATAAPATTGPDDRRGCHALSATNAKAHPIAHRDAGALAAGAADPGIKKAGIGLVKAANGVVAESSVETNLALDRARIALATACGAKFGDGPW